MTDFRALCAELLRSLENYPVQPLRDRDLCLRARAALAEQPVGPEVEPTLREEFTMILNKVRCNSPRRNIGNIELGRRLVAVVERFKQPTPIPVAERLPGPEDCDADGRCWLLFRSASMKMTPVWSLVQSRSIFDGPYTYWLPSNALQVPADV